MADWSKTFLAQSFPLWSVRSMEEGSSVEMVVGWEVNASDEETIWVPVLLRDEGYAMAPYADIEVFTSREAAEARARTIPRAGLPF